MKKNSKPSRFKRFFSSLFSFYMGAEIDITSVAVAYYLIISVFPILMALASLLPYLQIDVSQILDVAKDIFPDKLYPAAARLITSILTRPSSSWVWISVLATLWTISRSMDALQKAFNKAYGVGVHRDFIVSHIVGIFLGIGLQLILTLSTLMVAFGNSILQAIHKVLDFDNGLLMNLANQTGPAGYIALFLALVMLYFFLPNVRIRKLRFIMPGVIFVMVIMGTIGKLFGIYLEYYADKLLDFRFVTSVTFLVLMLWFVFMAQILIIGAVLNATVQSMFVDEFYTRTGDVVSILNRIKDRFQTTEIRDVIDTEREE